MRKPARSSKATSAKASNELRIIGGHWRGRKLQFPAADGLRPTPNRVRETLFNWLAAVVPGAHCLDLFAGSGALGFEALSRGAASVCWVDSAASVTAALRQNLQLLGAEGTVLQQSALEFLATAPGRPFDIVFLDPPFHQHLVDHCVTLLDEGLFMAADSWVYIEMAGDEAAPPVPSHWSLHRDKQAGQVCYRLYRISAKPV